MSPNPAETLAQWPQVTALIDRLKRAEHLPSGLTTEFSGPNGVRWNDWLAEPREMKGESTMTIDELKDWERNTPYMRKSKPDDFQRQGGWCSDSRNLLAGLRNLAPELIELW